MGSDVKIARALISVTDKTGVVDFARTLVDDFGVEIISTGGTARAIEDAGVPVTPIEEFTGYPEMMDGRVKTLHPKVHGALLARRDSEQHMQEAAQHGIKLIDLVVVNLYEFEKTVANPEVTFADAIEHIDIGGPSCCALPPRTPRALPSFPTLPTMMPSWPRCTRPVAAPRFPPVVACR